MHFEDDLLEPMPGRLFLVEHFEAPALPLRVTRVHPEQIGGEEGGLVTAGARADLDDDVALVIRIGGQPQGAKPLVLRLGGGELRLVLLLRHRHHLGVALRMCHLRGFAGSVLGLAPAARGLDDFAQLRLLSGQLLNAVEVLVRVRRAQQGSELAIPSFERGEALLKGIHAPEASKTAPSPERAASSAAMATSICASPGCRVLSSWAPSTGASAILPGTVSRILTSARMISYDTAATIGTRMI